MSDCPRCSIVLDMHKKLDELKNEIRNADKATFKRIEIILNLENEIAKMKRIIRDVATRMECNCDDMDYDCMPCDRCTLKGVAEK